MASIAVGLATGAAAASASWYLSLIGSLIAVDGSPYAPRVYPAGTEPGVTAHGDDRDHE